MQFCFRSSSYAISVPATWSRLIGGIYCCIKENSSSSLLRIENMQESLEACTTYIHTGLFPRWVLSWLACHPLHQGDRHQGSLYQEYHHPMKVKHSGPCLNRSTQRRRPTSSPTLTTPSPTVERNPPDGHQRVEAFLARIAVVVNLVLTLQQ